MSKPISQKGSPYWYYDFIIQGARFYGSTSLTSKRAAQQFIDRLRHEIQLPSLARPAITLDQACGLYEDHAGSLPSWPTAEYMIIAMVAPKTGLGAKKLLSEITQRDVAAYIARRRIRDDGKPRSNSSINRELDVIRAIWRHAKAMRYDVGEEPNWKDLRLKTARRTHRVLAAIEERPLFDAIRADIRPAIDFLFLSGWRRAEMIGLRWSDVDLAAMTAVTKIKGGDMVTRPLTQAMVVLIANQPKVGAFVFTYICARSASKIRVRGMRYPLTVTVLRNAWDAARDAANLSSNIRMHDIRHTRATRMLRVTRDLSLVKEALKHRNIQTTLQYAHVLDDDVRAGLAASQSLNSPEVLKPKSKKA